MDAKTGKILKYGFWALLALVLLYFSFRSVDWKEFMLVLRQSRWGFVFLAMAAGVLSFIFRAVRWRLLLLPDNPQAKAGDCYDGFTIGRLCDFAVPHVGELVRCGYVVSPGMTYDKALGTVLLERAWDVLMLILFTVLLLVCKWGEFGSFFSDKIFGPLTERFDMGLSSMLLLLLTGVAAAIIIVLALRRKSSALEKAADFIKGIGKGIASGVRMKGKGLFILMTVLLWTMFLLMSLFIIKALPDDFGLGVTDALFIMLVGSISGLVPVPGGFGAFHYLVAIALLAVYGIPFETGIIFATLSHESQAVTTIVCGALSYLHQALKRRK